MKICELKVNDGKQRENVVVALADAGYYVKVDHRKDKLSVSNLEDHYVVVYDHGDPTNYSK